MKVYSEWRIWKDMTKSSFIEDFISTFVSMDEKPSVRHCAESRANEIDAPSVRLCVRFCVCALAVSSQNCAVSGTRPHFPQRCLRSLRSGWCPQSWGPAGTLPGSRWSLFRWRDRRRFLAKEKPQTVKINLLWKLQFVAAEIRAHGEKIIKVIKKAIKQMKL